MRCRARAAARCCETEDVLEILSIPLLGIIPESQDVLKASNVGAPVTLNNPNSLPAKAYLEAARRLRGEAVDVTIPRDKKGIMGMLFGRKAA